jgi:N-acetylmuramoyl-L-alanine amidase
VDLVLSSGHGKLVRGASGFIDEVDEARRVVNRVAEYLGKVGDDATLFHDDVSKSQDENLNRIVDFHNSKTRDLDVSVHFNAYETTDSPMGCECLYLSNAELAADVALLISDTAGLINRGAKKRDDLFFLNHTDEPAILIEVCFVDSSADVELYDAHFEAICAAISEAISGVSAEMPELPSRPQPIRPTIKLLGVLEDCQIWHIIQSGKERVEWTAKMAVDCDGMPVNIYNDPYWQSQTSLSHNGKPINADEVPYIVVPPLVRNGVPGVVMGCQAAAYNTEKDLSSLAVVADQGPSEKIGEASCECARRIGLDGNPNHGGTDQHIVRYVIWPGQAATVDGVTYTLQPA